MRIIKIRNKNRKVQSVKINETNIFKYRYNKKTGVYKQKTKKEISKYKETKRIKEKIRIIKAFKRIRKEEKEKNFQKYKQKVIEDRKRRKEKAEKRKERKKSGEQKKKEGVKGKELDIWHFICKVSDRTIEHDYALDSRLRDGILEYHDSDYPNHEVQYYDLMAKNYFVEHKYPSSERITKQQEEFLIQLNAPYIPSTKSEASALIKKLSG